MEEKEELTIYGLNEQSAYGIQLYIMENPSKDYFCLKYLNYDDEPSKLHRILHEAQILRELESLHCPNIIKIEDIYKENYEGKNCLILKMEDGKCTLEEIMKYRIKKDL